MRRGDESPWSHQAGRWGGVVKQGGGHFQPAVVRIAAAHGHRPGRAARERAVGVRRRQPGGPAAVGRAGARPAHGRARRLRWAAHTYSPQHFATSSILLTWTALLLGRAVGRPVLLPHPGECLVMVDPAHRIMPCVTVQIADTDCGCCCCWPVLLLLLPQHNHPGPAALGRLVAHTAGHRRLRRGAGPRDQRRRRGAVQGE